MLYAVKECELNIKNQWSGWFSDWDIATVGGGFSYCMMTFKVIAVSIVV